MNENKLINLEIKNTSEHKKTKRKKKKRNQKQILKKKKFIPLSPDTHTLSHTCKEKKKKKKTSKPVAYFGKPASYNVRK